MKSGKWNSERGAYFNSSVQLLFFIINKETGSAKKYKTPKVIKESD
ncbi:MAG: hypothetical protein ACLUR5_12570 [Eubacterium ventriosum]